MWMFRYSLFVLCLLTMCSCNKTMDSDTSGAYRTTKKILYNNVSVDVVIDKPINNDVDVLIVYHGTVFLDSKILEAAFTTLDNFKRILDRRDMMIVSVAYPEENLFMGDNLLHAEAALLWVKHRASQELGITVKKIFLGGHSQGGYLVTRLNTLHATNGVIANGPGPLNLVYRCQLEENGQAPGTVTCSMLQNMYGTTGANTSAYFQRSLLNFTNGYLSDILFVQGMNDASIQLYSWPIFKEQVLRCSTCRIRQFVEIPNMGHTALFDSPQARIEFNRFIGDR